MQNTLSANPEAVRGELQASCDQGWQHLEAGDAEAACRVFEQLIESGIRQGMAGAGLDSVRETLLSAVMGLERGLSSLEEEAPSARHTALQCFYQAFQADVVCGANGLAKEASFALLRHADAQGRLELAARLRRELAAARDAGRAEHYWRLLLDLEALDPASLDGALAQVCKAGFPVLAAEKLLDLDRVGEALMLVRKELRTTEALLAFANSPAACGQLRAVMAMIEEHLAKAFDAGLADWLASRYAERGDLPRALDLRLRLLRFEPSEEGLEAVHDLAGRVGRWEQLRPQVERILRRARR